MIKPRIVAIDDEPEFVDMLRSYFIPRGYEISVSVRGVKGLELIREMTPDVVLCDLKMPGIDGDEVLKLLNTMQPAPKLIFVTAYDDGGATRARLLRMGAYAYFDKPIASLKSLEETINKAVNG